MSSLWRIDTLLILVLWGATVAAAPRATPPETISLSLEEFTSMALKNSLRSRIAEDSFYSSRWGWQAARRQLTWPVLSAEADKTKTVSDDDLGLETETNSDQGSLTLTQPFLTGTSLSLGGVWTDSESTFESGGGSTMTFSRTLPSFTATLTQPLFIFVGNQSLRSKKEADLSWENDQDSYRAEQLSIEFDARTRYYTLLLQRETTEVERKKLDSAKLVHDTTRALVRAGKLAEVEAVRADIRAKKDSRRIQNSENTLKQALNEAKDFLSLPPQSNLELTSQLRYKPFRIPLETLTSAALQHNPNLQISRRQVDLAVISLRNTREGNRPRVNASGSYSLTQDRSDESFPVDPTSWTVGVGMDWPLFDASQTRLRTRQSEVTVENAKRSYENQERQLQVDVENAYLEIKRAEEQIVDFEPQRVSAQRNVNAIRLQYRNGLTRLTDVFDAENELRDLELEYLGLLVDFNTSRDRLKILVGIDPEDENRMRSQ